MNDLSKYLEPETDMRVNIPGIGNGTIQSVRLDDRGEEILTICLDETDATPDGLYFSRRYECRNTVEALEAGAAASVIRA